MTICVAILTKVVLGEVQLLSLRAPGLLLLSVGHLLLIITGVGGGQVPGAAAPGHHESHYILVSWLHTITHLGILLPHLSYSALYRCSLSICLLATGSRASTQRMQDTPPDTPTSVNTPWSVTSASQH